jgi:hypothetical protein
LPSSAGSGSYSVFAGVFIAEEVERIGDKGSENTTVVDIGLQIFLKAFLNMSLRLACSFDEGFFWVKAKLQNLGLLSSSDIIKISELSDTKLKEFCCILKLHYDFYEL